MFVFVFVFVLLIVIPALAALAAPRADAYCTQQNKETKRSLGIALGGRKMVKCELVDSEDEHEIGVRRKNERRKKKKCR